MVSFYLAIFYYDFFFIIIFFVYQWLKFNNNKKKLKNNKIFYTEITSVTKQFRKKFLTILILSLIGIPLLKYPVLS